MANLIPELELPLVSARGELVEPRALGSFLRQAQDERYTNQALSGIDRKQQIANGGGLMSAFFQDLVYGARMLRRAPGFTVAAVLAKTE